MKLSELGLTEDEMKKVLYIAKLFNCQKMTVEDKINVDK